MEKDKGLFGTFYGVMIASAQFAAHCRPRLCGVKELQANFEISAYFRYELTFMSVNACREQCTPRQLTYRHSRPGVLNGEI